MGYEGSQQIDEIKVGMQSENNCFIENTHTQNKISYPKKENGG